VINVKQENLLIKQYTTVLQYIWYWGTGIRWDAWQPSPR